MSDQRTQVTLVDDGGWVAKTFIHEVKTNRPDVDVEEIITVPKGASLTEILNKFERPETLDIDEETQEVLDKRTVWLFYTAEGCRERNLYQELNEIKDDYPYLSIALYYGQMARSWLHELARKAKIVPMNHMVTDEGETVPAPQQLTKENILEEKFTDRKGRKYKINIVKTKKTPSFKPGEVSTVTEDGTGSVKTDVLSQNNKDKKKPSK